MIIETETRRFHIENIQKVTIGKKSCKTFQAFEEIAGAYVNLGAFAAPVRTPDKLLFRYIEDEER